MFLGYEARDPTVAKRNGLSTLDYSFTTRALKFDCRRRLPPTRYGLAVITRLIVPLAKFGPERLPVKFLSLGYSAIRFIGLSMEFTLAFLWTHSISVTRSSRYLFSGYFLALPRIKHAFLLLRNYIKYPRISELEELEFSLPPSSAPVILCSFGCPFQFHLCEFGMKAGSQVFPTLAVWRIQGTWLSCHRHIGPHCSANSLGRSEESSLLFRVRSANFFAI